MKSFANYSAKRGDEGEKSKLQYEAILEAGNLNRGQPAYKRQTLISLTESTPDFQADRALQPTQGLYQ